MTNNNLEYRNYGFLYLIIQFEIKSTVDSNENLFMFLHNVEDGKLLLLMKPSIYL